MLREKGIRKKKYYHLLIKKRKKVYDKKNALSR